MSTELDDIVNDALADLNETEDGLDDDTSESAEAAISIARDALQSVSEVESRLDDRIETLEATVEALVDRVETVEERTDMLDLIEQADAVGHEQRSAALFQHLKRAAERKDAGRQHAAVDRDKAEEALHFPDVERTTIYRDMERVERWVGDEDVCWYAEGTLKLDLDAADEVVTIPHSSSGGEQL